MIKKLLKIFFVFTYLTIWQLSGLYPLWQNPNFPPKIQKAEAASTGTLTAGANAAKTSSAGDNNGFETTPGNADGSDNNAYAVSTNTGTGNATDVCSTFNQSEDDAHDYYNFGIAPPAGSTIDGIQVNTIAKWSTNTGTNQLCVELSWNGGTSWTSTANTTGDIQTTESADTLGGSANTWGRAWTVSELNDTNFRIRVMIDPGGANTTAASLELLTVTVTYTPNSTPTLSISEPNGTSDSVLVGSSYNITYSLDDSDNVVTAAFYYDTDNTGLNGTAISGACATAAEGSGVTCAWDTTGISLGSYYVYGITNDGINGNVSAYSSGQITIQTVSVSVTITTDGTVAYGTLTSGQSSNTVSLTDTQTAQNDGNVAEDFNIKTSAPAGWSLGASSSTDTFVHEFSTNGGSNWTKFTTADSYQTLIANIATSGTQNFDLRFTAPDPSTSSTQKTITVTVQAVQH